MSMATKFGRVGKHNTELPSIKSQGPLKVIWKIRSVISLLLKGLWPPNLARA